jgi:5-formyltetrahydrofolate cyclo-ligase
MPKTSIRQTILNRRRSLAPELCLASSLQVQAQLLSRPEFTAAACVGLYSPIANEVFTEVIFHEAVHRGKRVVYPRICGTELEFFQVGDRQELGPGTFGVLEPKGERRVPLAGIDLAVVPGVAFDLCGHRLGYGKGFYDRAFGNGSEKPLLIGFAFEMQVVDQLPRESHDVQLDLLVTESRVVDFRH